MIVKIQDSDNDRNVALAWTGSHLPDVTSDFFANLYNGGVVFGDKGQVKIRIERNASCYIEAIAVLQNLKLLIEEAIKTADRLEKESQL